MGTKQDRVQFCAHASDPKIDIFEQLQDSHDLHIVKGSEPAPDDAVAIFTAPDTLVLSIDTHYRYVAETQLDTPEFAWSRTACSRIALNPVLLLEELSYELSLLEREAELKAEARTYPARGW